MIELYQFWDSPCCMKVRMVLAEKGLDWELRPVTTYKFDHYQPAYQALNPHSLVPTLVHDGRAIIQSSNIAEYLDDAFPDPPLKPADPGRRAEMREWMKEEEEFLFRLIVTLSFNTMMKMRAAAYGMDQLREWSLRHPDQTRAQDYLDRVSSPADAGAVAAADRKLRWHMERLETQLIHSGGPWVCGNVFSLADICLAGIVDRMEYLDRENLFVGLPAVIDWVAALRQRPSYQTAAPAFEDRMWGPLKPVPRTTEI
jgi:glutathione S-transferase